MKFLMILRAAFHGQGYQGYKSKDAQKKFAESLLKIADKMFWAPMAYLGVAAYQNTIPTWSGIIYMALFFILGVWMRHEALTVYDNHEKSDNKIEDKKRMLNK